MAAVVSAERTRWAAIILRKARDDEIGSSDRRERREIKWTELDAEHAKDADKKH
jgi:hypothetical protein